MKNCYNEYGVFTHRECECCGAVVSNKNDAQHICPSVYCVPSGHSLRHVGTHNTTMTCATCDGVNCKGCHPDLLPTSLDALL